MTHRTASVERGARATSKWRDALVAVAVLAGFFLVVHGLIKGKGLHLSSLMPARLWLNIAALAALTISIGAVAAVARRWSRRIFIGALFAALLIAFGWTSVLWAIVAFVAFAALGEAILPSRILPTASSLSVQAAIGAACYVLLLGLMVHFKVNFPLVYGALLLLPLLNRQRLSIVLGPFQRLLDPRSVLSIGEVAAGTLLLFIVALQLTTAGLPERYADGALYHLPLMQTVARLGYWPTHFELLVWATSPAGTDWLFGIGNMLAGQMGAKAIAYLVFLLLLTNLYAASLRNGVRSARALLLVALFASTPLAFIETTALFIENGLALFMLCGFAVLLLDECPAEQRVIACLILISAAAASKLHGFAVVGPLGLAALWMTLTKVPKRKRFPVIAGGLIILALGCQVYVYNYVLTGNPVFPFFNAVFRSPFYPPTNFIDSRWLQPAPFDLGYRATFHTSLYGEFGDGAFGFQWVALILGAIVFTTTSSWRARATIAFGLVYVFAISSGSTYARYVYPAFPVLVLAIGFLLVSEVPGTIRLSCKVRTVITALVVVLTLLNLAYFSTAGWPLSQNFWSGLFSAQKAQDAADASLPVIAMNRRASQDGLPAPRVLLFNDAVSADLDGTALTVNWYNQPLVNRFAAAHSIADVAKIIRDYGATYASFDLQSPSPYVDNKLIASALTTLGDPIYRINGLTLYKLHPDVWLGPNILSDAVITPSNDAWEKSGKIEWQTPNGAVLPDGASMQQTPSAILQPDRLNRLTVEMRCTAPEQQLHVAVLLNGDGRHDHTRVDDFAPCVATGMVTRTLDFISPHFTSKVQVIVDHASAMLVGAKLQDGYSVK